MKGNKFSDVVKEYARKLNDNDLRYIHMRLSNRIGPDVGEAVEMLQRSPEIDQWLASSRNGSDFFDMIDIIDNFVANEAKKRFNELKVKV